MVEFLTTHLHEGVAILAALSIFIEISPIKINPWSWILKRIGKLVNSDMEKRLAVIEKDLAEMKASNEQTKAETARSRILRFGDEVRNGAIRPSKEHYENVLQSIDEYERYCKDHPLFPNNQTVITSKIIRDTYLEKLKNNTF